MENLKIDLKKKGREFAKQIHGLFIYTYTLLQLSSFRARIVACAAASRAIGTRNGEHDT